MTNLCQLLYVHFDISQLLSFYIKNQVRSILKVQLTCHTFVFYHLLCHNIDYNIFFSRVRNILPINTISQYVGLIAQMMLKLDFQLISRSFLINKAHEIAKSSYALQIGIINRIATHVQNQRYLLHRSYHCLLLTNKKVLIEYFATKLA